jgi:hypothetical protein
MEEIDKAVVVKATASSKPANANPNAGLAKKAASSKVREEGELSSSEDDAAVLSSKSLKLTCEPLASFLFILHFCLVAWKTEKTRRKRDFGFTEREVFIQCS